jgi:chemotaxis protein MotB
MSRKDKEDPPGPDPNGWMVTFSDLLSLLLTFFVLLFAMKSLDEGKVKLKEALSYFSPGGIGVLETGEKMPMMKPMLEENPAKNMRFFSPTDLRRLLGMSKLEKDVQVSSDKRGVVLTLPGGILFGPGSSDLRPEAKAVLDEMADILYEVDALIGVEGHTDDLPIAGAGFPSNWELSIGRAGEVVRYLLGRGLRPDQFSVSGYADTRPIRPNNTPENRALNRRVELVLYH